MNEYEVHLDKDILNRLFDEVDFYTSGYNYESHDNDTGQKYEFIEENMVDRGTYQLCPVIAKMRSRMSKCA